MRGGRGLLAFLVLASALAAPASADEPGEPIHLDLRAHGACPDEAGFEARIRDRTTLARFVGEPAAERTFVVELEGGRPARGHVTVRRGAAVEGGREMRADSCAEVADALAMVVALAVDPEALLGTPTTTTTTTPTPTPTTAPAPASASTSAPVPASASAPTSAAAPASTPAPRAPALAHAPSPPPRTLFVGADLSLATGLSPDVLLGVAPFLGWRSSRPALLSPAVRLSFLRAGTGTVRAPTGDASFTWTVGRVDGCLLTWPRGPARLLACARVEAGVLDASGSSIASEKSSAQAWLAAGPLGRAEWALLPPLFLAAEVAAMVHVTDDRFFFLPDTTVYTVPLFGLEASAGLGAHFL